MNQQSPLEEKFAEWLELENFKGWESQYKFEKSRKWRFDFCHPEKKIAVELDGVSFHLNMAQARKDAEKRNFATAKGWKVFVFPSSCPLYYWEIIKEVL